MKNAIIKLLTVKSILTIVLTFVFAHLCFIGKIDGEAFLDVFKMIVIFYFGTQAAKHSDESK